MGHWFKNSYCCLKWVIIMVLVCLDHEQIGPSNKQICHSLRAFWDICMFSTSHRMYVHVLVSGAMTFREKVRDLTQSYGKGPYTYYPEAETLSCLFQAFGIHGHGEDEHDHGDSIVVFEPFVGYGLVIIAGNYYRTFCRIWYRHHCRY